MYLFSIATDLEAQPICDILKKDFKVAVGENKELPCQVVEYFNKSSEIAIVKTGIGVINTAIALSAVLTAYKLAERSSFKEVEGVINLGIAGSYDFAKANIGKLCFIKKEILPEFGLHRQENIEAYELGFPLCRDTENIVWNSLDLNPARNLEKLKLFCPVKGNEVSSLTVLGVSGTEERATFLRQKYGAELENMEGFAAAYTCFQYNIPFLEVRAVSNLVGRRPPVFWDIPKAMQSLENFVAENFCK